MKRGRKSGKPKRARVSARPKPSMNVSVPKLSVTSPQFRPAPKAVAAPSMLTKALMVLFFLVLVGLAVFIIKDLLM